MLLLRSDLCSQESLLGYVLRVSAANGHPGSAWLLDNAGLSQKFARVPCDLTGLAGLTGKSAAVLEAATYWPVPEKPQLRRFGARLVRVSEIVFHNPRICPRCLADLAICRRLWDLRCYVACHIHGCWMLDQCQACGRRIHWGRRAVGRCGCGFSFSAARAEPASKEVSGLSAAIAGLEADGVCNAVPGSDLDGLLAAAWYFGDLANSDGRRNSGVAKPAVQFLRAKMQAAATVLLDWPNGLRDWLIATRGDRPAQASMHLMFGNLLHDLRAALRGRADFVVNEIGNILTESWFDGAVLGKSYYYKAPHGAPGLGLIEAAHSLGVRYETIERMIECGDLEARVLPAGKRHFFWVDAKSLRRAKLLLERRLTHAQAAEYLGVSKFVLKTLRRAGFLPALSRRGRNSPYYYDRQLLEAFVRNLWHRATWFADDREVVSLPDVVSQALPICEVLTRINAGQISVARLAKDMTAAAGLRLIGVREKDLVGVRVLKKRVRADGEGHLRYSLRGAAAELGVNPRCIHIAVQRGLLRLARPDQPHAKFNIPAEALDEFRRDYRMSRAVAHRLGTNARGAWKLMVRAGYRPVVDPISSSGISAIWRAEDVTEFLAVTKRQS